MTRAELEQLARRVETEEPSVVLDGLVAVAFQRPFLRPHPYTSSLDAAASLMPEGWEVSVTVRNDQTGVGAWTDEISMVTAAAPTEPRARTAAALRAMGQEMGDDGN